VHEFLIILSLKTNIYLENQHYSDSHFFGCIPFPFFRGSAEVLPVHYILQGGISSGWCTTLPL